MEKRTFVVIAFSLFLLLCAAYSNHFTNGFQFDDSHTIVDNSYIRSIKNLPLFFTDIKYFGTNVGNQGYRPVTVSLNAIDYWIAGGLKPVFFHADIFLSYLLLLLLLFFLFKNIFNCTKQDDRNKLVALMAIGFYGLHAANAETINYIIQRADSFSTLLIVASLLLYINPRTRKYYLYLITTAMAIGTKEVGVITGILLFFYILLFEENTSLSDLITFKKNKNIVRAFKKSLPAIVICFLTITLSQHFLIQGHRLDTSEVKPNALDYYATQAVVIVHYLGNFLLPVNLSASSGFTIYNPALNSRVFFSVVILLSLIVIAFIASGEQEKRPIAFGIIWFFLALAPSSFVVKGGEIANDHRTFFPYIGLVMSLAWWLRIVYLKYREQNTKYKVLNTLYMTFYFLIVSLHAYGTHERNKVWSSDELLWHDAVIKSPDNSIALMNYGETLMEKGKYKETLPYFEHALQLNPYWAYINVNMAMLKDYMGLPQEADSFFRNAIRFQPFYPVGYYQYARFLMRYGKNEEALTQLNEGLKISPGDAQIIELLNVAKAQTPEAKEAEIIKMATFAGQNPTAANYINLSVVYYQNGMYEKCIEACEKALKLDPVNSMAYNNICGSYNALGQWQKAIEACRKSLLIDSTLELAKNNLSVAQKNFKL